MFIVFRKEPFEVHINHFGSVNRTDTVKKHVLVIIDAFMKYVRLYAVKSTTTRETIGCLKDYFLSYSQPRILIFDRGTSFISREFDEFMFLMGVNHIKIAAGSSQANEQVERYNCV